MKNIQEILIKCNGAGKLILGDEEIEVNVKCIKQEIENLERYVDRNLDIHDCGISITTKLEVSYNEVQLSELKLGVLNETNCK